MGEGKEKNLDETMAEKQDNVIAIMAFISKNNKVESCHLDSLKNILIL